MNLSGILVVDKPANTTSAQMVAVVKKLLGAGKIGQGFFYTAAKNTKLFCIWALKQTPRI